MIVDFPAPLFTDEQIAQAVNSAAADLNKKIAAHFGAPMNARTLATLKDYLFNFYSTLRPHLRLTQKDLDNRAQIALENFFADIKTKKDAEKFWTAVCSFNNSLQNCFATDAKTPADSLQRATPFVY